MEHVVPAASPLQNSLFFIFYFPSLRPESQVVFCCCFFSFFLSVASFMDEPDSIKGKAHVPVCPSGEVKALFQN